MNSKSLHLSNKCTKIDSDYLDFFHTVLEAYYRLYKAGKITEEEYLAYIKPIDEEIDKLELSTCNALLLIEIRFEREKRDKNIPRGMFNI